MSSDMEILRTRSVGGIVIGDGGMVVLVKHAGNKDAAWLFPKGHPDGDENDEETARREIQEEAGLTDLELLDDLGEYERPHMMPDGTDSDSEIRVIHMYLFSAPQHAMPVGSMEIGEARWFPFRELGNVIGNTRDRAWFATVAPRVREAIQRD